jgi:hypothetical protein
VERWIDACRGFVLMHKHCPKPAEVSPQLALPGTEPAISVSVLGDHEHCDHKFVDSKDCLKCGIGFAELKAESLRESQRLNASADSTAPEIDPPGPYAMFERMYPLAVSAETLNTALAHALTTEQWAALNLNDVARWHPASGIFNAIANWARIEKAHLDTYARAQAGEPAVAGLTLPRREPMPEKLAELLGEKAKRMKGARPLSSPRKRKAAGAEP